MSILRALLWPLSNSAMPEAAAAPVAAAYGEFDVPASQNYALPYQNIVHNDLANEVTDTNLVEHRALISRPEDAGFTYPKDQVNRHMRTSGSFKGVGNYVF